MKTRKKYAKLVDEGWEVGSKNVFHDLGLPNAGPLQAKAYLRAIILARIEALGISQTEAARRAHLTQPKISNLLKGTSPAGFSSDKLIDVATRLGLDVELRAKAAPPGSGRVPGVSFLRNQDSFRVQLFGTADARTVRRKITGGSVTANRLRTVRERLGLSADDVSRVLGVAERTIVRKERQRAPLSATEGDRAYRLARIADVAVEVMCDEAKATSWLRTPNSDLAGATPVSLLDTEVGAELVVDSLYGSARETVR
jgi:putative toxin-antitoxin system antitoxin component (TIGR02293 family)